MTFSQLQVWLNQYPILSPIILVFLVFTVMILRLNLRLKSAHFDQQQQYQRLASTLEKDHEKTWLELGKLAQSIAIRSEQFENLSNQQSQRFRQENELAKNSIAQAINQLREGLQRQQTQFQQTHNQQLTSLQRLLTEQLARQSEQVRINVEALNRTTEKRLRDMTQCLNQQLDQSFAKTNTTFINIQKRLSAIDEAQKRIDHLSSNVVALQSVLTDKKTRGVFGEMQLQTIIENVLPPQFVDFQYTLANHRRADCIIHLPEPNGDIVIDAKFPLENYRQLVDNDDQARHASIAQTFKRDIKKHISDIADKYILPPETAESAILFIPAEAIFAEIHAYHHDIVEFAQYNRVWLASPTTLMAILTTSKSVIKDEATRRQTDIMREQLLHLKDDFTRFQNRMNNLAKHIDQANHDVAEVNTSANKISKHFLKIEATDEWQNPALTDADKSST